MNLQSNIQAMILDCGFTESGIVPKNAIHYYPEIRKICEGNSCRGYAASWACPPAVGTLEECKSRIDSFNSMILFSKKYDLEDSFDFDGMRHGMRDFKKALDALNARLKNLRSEYLLLGNEGCGRCAECTYPDAPCRFPDLLIHSIEGYGLIVNELANEAGVRYSNGTNTVTFFGAILLNIHDINTEDNP